jgi:hypothetical protein
LKGGGPVSSSLSSLLSYEYKMIYKILSKSDGVRFIEALKNVNLPSEKLKNGKK